MSSPPAGPLAPHVAAISLTVRDVGRAAAFYEQLGLVADSRTDRHTAVFQLNGVLLYLEHWRPLERADQPPGRLGGSAVSLRHDVTEDADIEAVLDRVRLAGGTVLRTPERTHSGGRHAWFSDLDGHRWELAYNPRVRRDQHGGVWLPPRERVAPVATDAELSEEADTDDLGPALVTMEDSPYIAPEAPTVVLATAVVVEDERPVRRPDRPRPAPRKAPPVVRRSASVRPRPRAPAPSGSSSPPITPSPRSKTGRAMGWVALFVAPLGGAVLAWGLLRFILP